MFAGLTRQSIGHLRGDTQSDGLFHSLQGFFRLSGLRQAGIRVCLGFPGLALRGLLSCGGGPLAGGRCLLRLRLVNELLCPREMPRYVVGRLLHPGARAVQAPRRNVQRTLLLLCSLPCALGGFVVPRPLCGFGRFLVLAQSFLRVFEQLFRMLEVIERVVQFPLRLLELGQRG